MASINRTEWQKNANEEGADAEKLFFEAFTNSLKHPYVVESKPKDFKNLYTTVDLPVEVLEQIYTPETKITRHGLAPDYVIRNIETGKSLYVEIKKQNGWVEGGARQDGRGNAHERCLKYFSPGLLNSLRAAGNISENELPFWVVFQGNITRDPCRVREISLWFTGHEDHFFMWRPFHSDQDIVSHFNKKLKNILE